MHSSTRVADLLGLLFILQNEFAGKTDLFELEKRLEVDLDDFMPIVYAADDLGFITIGDGDIIISDKGTEFIRSTLKKRKELIRGSLFLIEPFKTAASLALFDIDRLKAKLSEQSIMNFEGPGGKHDLEVLMNDWGVYSGMFNVSDDGVYQLVQSN